MNEKKEANIQIKVSQTEKEQIGRLATSANLDVSKFIRTLALSEDKVIFLDKGGYIAKSLIEINDKLNCALRNGQINDSLGKQLIDNTEKLFEKFAEITEQLTDISPDESESD